MALILRSDTQVRFSPQVVKTIHRLSESEKRYYAKKFSYPHLLDVEFVAGERKRLRLVRVQFCGTRRAVGRFLSNNLCIIALGIKSEVEHFDTYRNCAIGINDCVPLAESPLAPLLDPSESELTLGDVRDEFAASINKLKEEVATRENMDEMFALLTEDSGEHHDKCHHFREQATQEIERLRGDLSCVKQCLEAAQQNALAARLKTFFVALYLPVRNSKVARVAFRVATRET